MERAGDLLAGMALGHTPPEVVAAHARSEVITPEKAAGGLRPLLMGTKLWIVSISLSRAEPAVAGMVLHVELEKL